jgi:hypothetical protein
MLLFEIKRLEALFCTKTAIYERTDECDKQEASRFISVQRALMYLLQNTDTAKQDKCKRAVYEPTAVDFPPRFLF